MVDIHNRLERNGGNTLGLTLGVSGKQEKEAEKKEIIEKLRNYQNTSSTG
ncbi:MAG: hypothetical protein LBG59_08215 [Candidatus Peribacteria bacterium]|jgi:hypothetical protein|nr:hypothetical protein [Candidatus Peribacteria bacterium]